MDPPMVLPYPSVNYPVDFHSLYQSQFSYPQFTLQVTQQVSQQVSQQLSQAMQYSNFQQLQPPQVPQPQPSSGFMYPVATQPVRLHAPQSYIGKILQYLPIPPLAKVPTRPNVTIQPRRTRRKSKFTRAQDELIVKLKRDGKNWAEIAEITKVGSYLAARNRYQVIIGQQGNNNQGSWSSELNGMLKQLLDKYEIEKWNFITEEMNKINHKKFTVKEVQGLVKELFAQNPYSFGVSDELISELIKERKINERAVEKGDFEDFLNYEISYND